VESPRFLWKASENRSVNTRSVNKKIRRLERDLGLSADYLRIICVDLRISAAQKQMRPGPATQAASFVVSCSCLVTARWRNDRFSPTALQRSAAFCQSQLPVRHLAITNLQPLRWPAALVLLPASKSKEHGGEEAAMPGPTSRTCARFLECPPTIHPRESPTAAGSAAIIRQAQELSRFAELTLRQILAPRNTKKLRRCAEAVEDASSLWKP
jgi:hypothetical protein